MEDLKELVAKIKGIYNFKCENPEVDPNLYEIVDLQGQIVNMLQQHAPDMGIYNEPNKYLRGEDGKPTDVACVLIHYKKIYDANINALKNNNLNVTEKHPIYRMLDESNKKLYSYSAEDNELTKRLAGIKLYLLQEARALTRGEKSKVAYDNTSEFENLKELYNEYTKRMNEDNESLEGSSKSEVFEDIEEIYIKTINEQNNEMEI